MRGRSRVLGARRPAIVPALLAALFSGAVACSTIVGLDADYDLVEPGETGGGGGGGNECEPIPNPNACDECINAQCCVEYTVCHNDVRCQDFFNKCVPGCAAQDDCILTCGEAAGAGFSEAAAYVACTQRDCFAECGDTNDVCANCLHSQCANPAYDCQSDSDCWKLQECIYVCMGDPACETTCRDDTDAGSEQKYDELVTCETTKCANEC